MAQHVKHLLLKLSKLVSTLQKHRKTERENQLHRHPLASTCAPPHTSKNKSLYISAEADYVLNYGLIPNPQEQTDNLLQRDREQRATVHHLPSHRLYAALTQGC